MIKFNFTSFPAITTGRLLLRQVQMRDLNEYYILKSDESILEYVDYPARTFDQARLKLLEINKDISNNKSITWGITEKDNDKLMGTICFWDLNELESKAEIGYEMIPDYQGKGYMQEALKAVLEYGFDSMKLTRIAALPKPDHIQSRKLLEKSGFILEEEHESTAVYKKYMEPAHDTGSAASSEA